MKALEYRLATENDLDLLAEWNHQLIHDEGHRNPMIVQELRQRMKDWLAGEYQAVIFMDDTGPEAYALFKESLSEIYLRQFFVKRECRRQGIGRKAVRILMERIWSRNKRLTVDALIKNESAIAFWHSMGYQDYCLTLEIMPEA